MRKIFSILILVVSVLSSKNSYSHPINLQTFPQSVKLGSISEEQRVRLLDLNNNLINNPYDYLLIDAKSSFNSQPLFIALDPQKPFYISANSLSLKYLKYSSLVYNPETEWVLFNGEEAKKNFYVINGRKTPSFDEIPLQRRDYRRIVDWMSSDGKKLFFYGCNVAGKQKVDLLFSDPLCSAVVSDTQKDQVFSLKKIFEHPKFETDEDFPLKFSPNSEHFFFRLNNTLIWDGKLNKAAHSMEGPYFNSKGDKGLSIGEWRGKNIVLINGEQVSQEYDWIRCDHNRLFNEQGDWMCLAGLQQKVFILENGKEIESFENVENISSTTSEGNYNAAQFALAFYSPIDGKKIFHFIKDKKNYIWINGKEELIYENKGDEVFSLKEVWFEKGSGEILYLLSSRKSFGFDLNDKKQGHEFFIHKNNKSPIFNSIRITQNTLYNSNGVFEHLYYEATKNSKYYFFKEKLYGPFERVNQLIVSPDQKHWALKVEEKIDRSSKKFLSPEYYLIDGKKEETFSKGVHGFEFSSNSQSYLYMAENNSDPKKDRKLYFIVKGDKNNFTQAKEGVYPQVHFLPKSENFYIWRQGRSYGECESNMKDGSGRLCEDLFSSILLGMSEEQGVEGGYILTHQKIQFSEDGKKMGYLSLTPERELWWNVQNVDEVKAKKK